MRRLTSAVAAGALALALAVPAPAVRAAAPCAETVEAASWFQQLVAQLRGYFTGGATSAPSEQDTGPDWDPNGFTSPGTDTGPHWDPNGLTNGPDHGPTWDPNG